jgi:hydrogenase small subunit
MSHTFSLQGRLAERGISRRQFLGFCSSLAATLALPAEAAAQIAQALEGVRRPVLVWLEFQDCAGNSESMLRASHPDIAQIVLDLFSWEYHETIMSAAGKQAEAALDDVVTREKGKFVVVVEGAIPTAYGGGACMIGGRSAMDIANRVCPNAALVIAVGSCAFDGGPQRSSPNPTGALSLSEAVPGVKVVNMSGCPHNAANTAALLAHWLTFHDVPALDRYNRPLFVHGSIIHDQCERRAHFDAGRFVERWDDEGARHGYCLYKMGCKGPMATFNCPTVRWNDATSWPVKSGHGCVACASYRFWDTASPFYERLPGVPGFGADVTAGEIGGLLTAAVGAGVLLHGIGSLARAKIRPAEEQGRIGTTEPGGPDVEEPEKPPEGQS